MIETHDDKENNEYSIMDSGLSTLYGEYLKRYGSVFPRLPQLLKSNNTVLTTGLIWRKNRVTGIRLLNQYKIEKKIGFGSHGKVFRAWDIELKRLVAIKRMKIGQKKFGRKIQSGVDELEACLTVGDHPNVVKLLEVIHDADFTEMCLVFEYIEGGPLLHLDSSGKVIDEPVPERRSHKYFVHLMRGLEHLHNRGVIHRDIKPENLLVDDHDVVKITDFGLSSLGNIEDDLISGGIGTPAFIPPEAISNHDSRIGGKASDIWSCGVVLYCLVCGYLPFRGTGKTQNEVLVSMFSAIQHAPLTLPKKLSPQLKDLLRKLLHKDPKKRITMNEILIHPWVSKHSRKKPKCLPSFSKTKLIAKLLNPFRSSMRFRSFLIGRDQEIPRLLFALGSDRL